MSKTQVSGKQVKDGSIELVDLGTTVVDELNSKVSASSLATVATTGSYNDLADKPSAFSGSYNDLTDKPTIPSLTQVETDISNLQAADVLLDSRLDALEGHALVIREIPTGSVDGVNAVFTLANTPVVGSEQVFVNGILQELGAANDYTISGSTITFVEAPLSGWKIHVSYATGNFAFAGGSGSGSGASYEIAEFSHPEQFGTWATYTITHNLNTLHPNVLLQANYAPGDHELYPGGGWGSIDYLFWGGYSTVIQGTVFTVVDANTVDVRIYRVGSGSRQIRGVVTVGGGSSAPSVYESDVVTVPYYGIAQVNLTQEFAHNLGYKPTNIQVVVDDTNVSTNPNYSDPGNVIPLATTYWGNSHVYGYMVHHLDNNRILIRFWFMGQQYETKVRVRCS